MAHASRSRCSTSPQTPSAWRIQAIVIVGILFLFTLTPLGVHANPLGKYFTEADFKKVFPHANMVASPKAAPNYYSYINMLEALESSNQFALFLSEGDETVKRLELAALLANWAQETTGGWDGAGAEYPEYGLVYQEEVGARTSPAHCYWDDKSPYQPSTTPQGDTCFFGRGPIQLSWNANYARLSDFIYHDQNILLNSPDTILQDGKDGFISGFWFWMIYDTSQFLPDTTCHKEMVKNGAKGFGKVINIVNGGIECNHPLYPWEPTAEDEPDPDKRAVMKTLGRKIRHRADHYQFFADYLGVGDQLPPRPKGLPNGSPEWDDYYRDILVGCVR